jgi:probable rRNA maturation factor
MLDVVLDALPIWGGSAEEWTEVADRAARAAIGQTAHGEFLTHEAMFELSVKLADNEEVQALNAVYRNKDKPTNVLSFPMLPPDFMDAAALTDDGEILLGDVILAYETCAAEAAEKGISVHDHAVHLIVHGVLHLLGYDHEQHEQAAERMEAIEIRALASLGLADPYA